MEFKGTFGKWTIGGISTDGVFIGAKESIIDIATVYKYDDSFLERQEMEANAKLISCAPEMLEALKESNKVIRSLKMSMMAHPDCEPNSEFDDFTDMAQEIEDSNDLLILKATTI